MNFPSFSVRSLSRALAATFALAVAVPAQFVPPSPPQLPAGCEVLQVPAGNVPTLRVYAIGVQTYQWNAATQSWTFTGPQAVLFSTVFPWLPIGVHYAGPTWAVPGAGVVAGSTIANHTVNPNAIPWLLLAATGAGPGVLAGTTFVQRVNTWGGRAPASSGTADQAIAVPYTAEYYFYRAQ